MKIREVKLYDCKIDSEFSEGKDGVYSFISKAIVGNDELESIIYVEINKDQYKYLTSVDYKEMLFNLKGVFQIRKNKKDIPFMIFKVNFIMDNQEIEALKIRNEEKIKNKAISQYNKIKGEKKRAHAKKVRESKKFNWKEIVPNLDEKLIEMNVDNIIITHNAHINSNKANIEIVRENPRMVVRKIEESNKYELILGFKSFVSCKVFNIPARVYVINESREKFVFRMLKKHKELGKEIIEPKEIVEDNENIIHKPELYI